MSKHFYNCPSCGEPRFLDIEEQNQKRFECESCETVFSVPCGERPFEMMLQSEELGFHIEESIDMNDYFDSFVPFV